MGPGPQPALPSGYTPSLLITVMQSWGMAKKLAFTWLIGKSRPRPDQRLYHCEGVFPPYVVLQADFHGHQKAKQYLGEPIRCQWAVTGHMG